MDKVLTFGLRLGRKIYKIQYEIFHEDLRSRNGNQSLESTENLIICSVIGDLITLSHGIGYISYKLKTGIMIEPNLRFIHLQQQQQFSTGQRVLPERYRHFHMYIDWFCPVDRCDYISWQRPHEVLYIEEMIRKQKFRRD
jgi:hypothetical protein